MAIATTLRDIMGDPIVAQVMDKGQRVNNLVDRLEADWRVDLEHRRPAPVYLETPDGMPIVQTTDLDLFTVMMSLAQGRRVINIPHYDRQDVTSLRSDQFVISNENRHGQVKRLVSNRETHNFCVMIQDYNVLQVTDGRQRVGAPRDFTIVNDAGEFYEGWSSLNWFSSPEEDAFLQEHNLVPFKDSIDFQYFVHPALALSFFGRRYLRSKMLARRLDIQRKYYYDEAEQLMEEGIHLPAGEGTKPISSKEGKTRPVKVVNLEAKLHAPDLSGKWPVFGIDYKKGEKKKFVRYERKPRDRRELVKILRYDLWLANKLKTVYGPIVRVPVRAVELAFFLYGFKDELRTPGSEIIPGWKVPEWARDYRETPRSRIRWNVLPYNDHVRLLYRLRETTVRRRA